MLGHKAETGKRGPKQHGGQISSWLPQDWPIWFLTHFCQQKLGCASSACSMQEKGVLSSGKGVIMIELHTKIQQQSHDAELHQAALIVNEQQQHSEMANSAVAKCS